MADGSSIEWTDATWNIVTGCSVVSPGCTNCYAMRLAGTRLKRHRSRQGLTVATKAGPVWNGKTRVNWEWIDQPLRWTLPRQIFVCAHGDLFHPSVAWEDVAVIYGVMIAAHHLRGHILQVLTKRPDRARELLCREDFWEVANEHASAEIMERVDPLDRRSDDARATCDAYGPGNPPPGILVGTSIEDRVRMLERAPVIKSVPTVLAWWSVEPLLGDLGGILPELMPDWIVAGGESGPGARPMHPDWARSLRDQCAAAGVPFFFKQWGAWAPLKDDNGGYWPSDADGFCRLTAEGLRAEGGWPMQRVGKAHAGRRLDGVTHDATPEVADG